MSAIACRFDFIDGIGYFKEAARPFEQMRLKVCAKPVAYHIAAQIVDDARQLVDLRLGKELCLVDEIPVDKASFLTVKVSGKLLEVRGVVNPPALTLDANARAYHVCLLTSIYHRFEAHVVHVALFKVICRRKQQSRLCRAHCAIAEIQFTFSIHRMSEFLRIKGSYILPKSHTADTEFINNLSTVLFITIIGRLLPCGHFFVILRH